MSDVSEFLGGVEKLEELFLYNKRISPKIKVDDWLQYIRQTKLYKEWTRGGLTLR